MKKIMVIALALIMMLSCIACANNAADNSAANGSDETPVLKVALSPPRKARNSSSVST